MRRAGRHLRTKLAWDNVKKHIMGILAALEAWQPDDTSSVTDPEARGAKKGWATRIRAGPRPKGTLTATPWMGQRVSEDRLGGTSVQTARGAGTRTDRGPEFKTVKQSAEPADPYQGLNEVPSMNNNRMKELRG